MIWWILCCCTAIGAWLCHESGPIEDQPGIFWFFIGLAGLFLTFAIGV